MYVRPRVYACLRVWSFVCNANLHFCFSLCTLPELRLLIVGETVVTTRISRKEKRFRESVGNIGAAAKPGGSLHWGWPTTRRRGQKPQYKHNTWCKLCYYCHIKWIRRTRICFPKYMYFGGTVTYRRQVKYYLYRLYEEDLNSSHAGHNHIIVPQHEPSKPIHVLEIHVYLPQCF